MAITKEDAQATLNAIVSGELDPTGIDVEALRRIASDMPYTDNSIPGRTRKSMLPMSTPEGMSAWDALTSGQAEWALPGIVGDMKTAGLDALDAVFNTTGAPQNVENQVNGIMTVVPFLGGAGFPSRGAPKMAPKPSPHAALNAQMRSELRLNRGRYQQEDHAAAGYETKNVGPAPSRTDAGPADLPMYLGRDGELVEPEWDLSRQHALQRDPMPDRPAEVFPDNPTDPSYSPSEDLNYSRAVAMDPSYPAPPGEMNFQTGELDAPRVGPAPLRGEMPGAPPYRWNYNSHTVVNPVDEIDAARDATRRMPPRPRGDPLPTNPNHPNHPDNPLLDGFDEDFGGDAWDGVNAPQPGDPLWDEDPFGGPPNIELPFVDEPPVDDWFGNPPINNPNSSELPAWSKDGGDFSMFSTTRRAAEGLKQEKFGDMNQLRTQLRNNGASETELQLYDKTLFADGNPVPTKSQVLEALSQDAPVKVLQQTGKDTPFSANFMPGAQDYTVRVIGSPNSSGSNQVHPSQAHFGFSSGNHLPVVHTRTGLFDFEAGGQPAPAGKKAFMLGEAQSDWGQKLHKYKKDKALGDELFGHLQENTPQSVWEKEFRKLNDKSTATDQEYRSWRQKIDPYINPLTDQIDPSAPADIRAGYENATSAMEKMIREGDALRLREVEVLNKEPINLDSNAMVDSTDKWTTLAIRDSLLQAGRNPDAEYFTLPTGKMVQDVTFGDTKGQAKFYEEIMPKNVDKELRRIAKQNGIEPPKRETISVKSGGEKDVMAWRITPELREALRKNGLPGYKEGGIVSLLKGA